jgi:hypothetical protein
MKKRNERLQSVRRSRHRAFHGDIGGGVDTTLRGAQHAHLRRAT